MIIFINACLVKTKNRKEKRSGPGQKRKVKGQTVKQEQRQLCSATNGYNKNRLILVDFRFDLGQRIVTFKAKVRIMLKFG